MFWGAISATGPVNLTRLDGRINSEVYREVLINGLLPYLDENGRDLSFQQDNASVHVSAVMNEFFAQEGLLVMNWPARSPDLNPIENVWGRMKNAVAKKAPQDEVELVQFVQEAWKKIVTPEYCARLYGSMLRRVQKVMKYSGGRNGY